MTIAYHAIIRYLERVCGHDVEGIRRPGEHDRELVGRLATQYGLDVAAVRREICPPRAAIMARFVWTGRVPIGNGYNAVLEDGIIVTIVPGWKERLCDA